jgi:hypothetical protein
MNAEERKQKIELYGKGFEMLAETLAAIPRAAWQFKPESKEWSIHEVLIHIADSETNAALRARMLVAQPGSGVLMGYDQDMWAVKLNYHEQNPDDALQMTKFARLTTYNWLKTLPEAVFAHAVKHPEYAEPYTFEMWLDIYSAHIPGHIEQIKNDYALWQGQGRQADKRKTYDH